MDPVARNPRISILDAGQLSAHLEAIWHDLAPVVVFLLAEHRRGSAITTNWVHAQLECAQDDLAAARERQDKRAYVAAVTKIAACAILLLLARRLDVESP